MAFNKKNSGSAYWVALAFGLSVSGNAAVDSGKLESVTRQGLVTGWVSPSSNSPGGPTLRFYLDGAQGKQGTELFFEAAASAPRADGNVGFEARIPDTFGDNQSHTVHAYRVEGSLFQMLPGSPLTFKFKSVPAATLKILSPKSGQTVTGSTLTLRYAIEGDTALARHAHWKIDDQPDVMDMEAKGTFVLTGVRPGKHTLHGYLAKGHHEKILHTDVRTTFVVKGEKEKRP